MEKPEQEVGVSLCYHANQQLTGSLFTGGHWGAPYGGYAAYYPYYPSYPQYQPYGGGYGGYAGGYPYDYAGRREDSGELAEPPLPHFHHFSLSLPFRVWFTIWSKEVLLSSSRSH